ncbi:4Fe-4S single cluster domain-containing protein [Methanolobus sp. WCC1]|jgi:anaerobic ribonucleoside-triphosphate reductase activating protein|uniref:4Fe-4S single cluster domain-containing protein n=1 Tax=unclassified Methanolobus TaxID=2629569 RepID=UPI002587020E|nr:4Fe-4S single cluster domain-containing protein [Methanolobus sp.]MDK2831232.1 anaerobic ribonucleoside-triphosphate reductase activating protein [Methanolobus sp.]
MDESPLLNVADVVVGSYVNGPGKRIVIWVQGCTIGCKGCFNTTLQPHVAKTLVDPEKFALKIVKLCKDNNCEGITLTGGEPFQQSYSLGILTKVVKENKISVVCFSGYTSKKLLNSNDKHVNSLLDNIDILIAGPFQMNVHYPNRTWFDDPDKELVFFTDTYDRNGSFLTDNVEYIVDGEKIQLSGFVDEIDNDIQGNFKNSVR